MYTQTLIIGGGLSGLSLAARLAAEGRDFRLVEARDRWGGRILTQRSGEGAFDLGPSWFWPGQPRMAALVDRLGLTRFDQVYEGDLIFEDQTGHVQRGRGFASMQGSWRVRGGLGRLIEALLGDIPQDRLHSSTPVETLHKTATGITARAHMDTEIEAQQVVLALPPRIAARLSCFPALPDHVIATMERVPTWMAGQAKAVAIYDRPFWREAGLSGDAMSRFGPMVECHDASPAEGGPYAIFGFIGVSPANRHDEKALREQICAQLSRLFGPEASEPKNLFLKDWAADPFTATELDHRPVHAHPDYGLPHVLSRLWGNALILSGTEVAPTFGGFLEGALEAAERAYVTLNRNGD